MLRNSILKILFFSEWFCVKFQCPRVRQLPYVSGRLVRESACCIRSSKCYFLFGPSDDFLFRGERRRRVYLEPLIYSELRGCLDKLLLWIKLLGERGFLRTHPDLERGLRLEPKLKPLHLILIT